MDISGNKHQSLRADGESSAIVGCGPVEEPFLFLEKNCVPPPCLAIDKRRLPMPDVLWSKLSRLSILSQVSTWSDRVPMRAHPTELERNRMLEGNFLLSFMSPSKIVRNGVWLSEGSH